MVTTILPVLLVFTFLLCPCESRSAILDLLVDEPNLSNFTALLKSADYLDGLSCAWWCWWCQQYTILAPTNTAFTDNAHSFDDLLASNRDDLIRFLSNLIIEEKPNTILDGEVVWTTGGERLQFVVDGEDLITIKNDRYSLQPDRLDATNGIVLVIDELIVSTTTNVTYATPQENATLWSTLDTVPSLSTFAAALDMVGLKSWLQEGTSNLTIFAPSNLAFERLGANAFVNLLDDSDALKELILYHIIPKYIAFDDLDNNGVWNTVQGDDIIVEFQYEWIFVLDKVTVNVNAELDIDKKNIHGGDTGVVYVIDEVLIPNSLIEYITLLNES